MRKAFITCYELAGGRIHAQDDPIEKVLQRMSLDQAKIEADHYTKNAKKIRAKIEELEIADAKKEGREIEITKIYNKLQAQKIPDEDTESQT